MTLKNFFQALKMALSLFGLLATVSLTAYAEGYVIVGNGDDGSDLEGVTKIETGLVVTARDKAVTLLEKLNVVGIPGLGNLVPEVQHSPLFIAKENVVSSLVSDRSNFHSDVSGKVFARTLAQPYASTRFFPISLKLEEAQLVALHIHEGLHRALPADYRQDENVVSEITLALTSPQASHDSVKEITQRLVRENDIRYSSPSLGGYGSSLPSISGLGHERMSRPSSVGYSLSQFWQGGASTFSSVNRLHVIHSDLYPFGGVDTPFGMGLQMSALEGPASGLQMGPLGIAARLRAWSIRDFEIGIFAQASVNLLSAKEKATSPVGRDVFTAGISMRKTIERFYVENFLSVTAPGIVAYNFPSTFRGGGEYLTYDYGTSVNAKIRTGYRSNTVEIGGFIDLFVVDHFIISGRNFNQDTGRFKLVSIGPEASIRFDEVTVSIFGRHILSTDRDVNFDYLGNILQTGAALGSVGASVAVSF